jgi:hypothetical protein
MLIRDCCYIVFTAPLALRSIVRPYVLRFAPRTDNTYSQRTPPIRRVQGPRSVMQSTNPGQPTPHGKGRTVALFRASAVAYALTRDLSLLGNECLPILDKRVLRL